MSSRKNTASSAKPVATPVSATVKATRNEPKEPLLFGKQNYMLILAAAALVAVGLLLMLGGAQQPDQWNADEIYSLRRTALAPFVILCGLAVGIFAIFKQSDNVINTNE